MRMKLERARHTATIVSRPRFFKPSKRTTCRFKAMYLSFKNRNSHSDMLSGLATGSSSHTLASPNTMSTVSIRLLMLSLLSLLCTDMLGSVKVFVSPKTYPSSVAFRLRPIFLHHLDYKACSPCTNPSSLSHVPRYNDIASTRNSLCGDTESG